MKNYFSLIFIFIFPQFLALILHLDASNITYFDEAMENLSLSEEKSNYLLLNGTITIMKQYTIKINLTIM